MISHQHACIFVHIPKTAGTSIEDVIWPGERGERDLWMGMTGMRNRYQTGPLQHLMARHIRMAVGRETFERYFKFSIVRNPWDRLVSQYLWLRDTNGALRSYIGMRDGAPFNEYLELIQQTEHVHWAKQVDFIFDDDGAEIVDFVGRFETIDKDAGAIFSQIGLANPSLPHKNAAPDRRHYRDYYDERSAELVASLYREDVEVFGYSF